MPMRAPPRKMAYCEFNQRTPRCSGSQ
jgi:hypothetical protein